MVVVPVKFAAKTTGVETAVANVGSMDRLTSYAVVPGLPFAVHVIVNEDCPTALGMGSPGVAAKV